MAKVPGSLFRRTLFWAHLCCGVAAGILILVMSFTGVLLAYERQIVDSKAEANQVTIPDGATRLSADDLMEKARAAVPAGSQLNLAFDADPASPVVATYGRQQLLLHPLTGEVIPDAAAGVRGVLRTIENWHRWLGGSAQSAGTSLMHIANLLFVFIILSGIYLWLPPVWNWPIFRGRMLFKPKYVNARVRDYSWHHTFSFWTFIPLFVIALSGVVMSYPWANSMLFAAYGETAPQRGGPPGGAPGGAPSGQAAGQTGGQGNNQAGGAPNASGERGAQNADSADAPAARATKQQLLDVARTEFSNWQRISMPANARGDTIDVSAEIKSDGARAQRQTMTLSSIDASVVRKAEPPKSTPGQTARAWMRFAHTGEQYGVIGQTIAFLASLAACFLVYTGLALAWRRLIMPLYRKS